MVTLRPHPSLPRSLAKVPGNRLLPKAPAAASPGAWTPAGNNSRTLVTPGADAQRTFALSSRADHTRQVQRHPGRARRRQRAQLNRPGLPTLSDQRSWQVVPNAPCSARSACRHPAAVRPLARGRPAGPTVDDPWLARQHQRARSATPWRAVQIARALQPPRPGPHCARARAPPPRHRPHARPDLGRVDAPRVRSRCPGLSPLWRPAARPRRRPGPRGRARHPRPPRVGAAPRPPRPGPAHARAHRGYRVTLPGGPPRSAQRSAPSTSATAARIPLLRPAHAALDDVRSPERRPIA